MFSTKERESICEKTEYASATWKSTLGADELQIDSEVQNIEFDMLSWYRAEWSWENW